MAVRVQGGANAGALCGRDEKERQAAGCLSEERAGLLGLSLLFILSFFVRLSPTHSCPAAESMPGLSFFKVFRKQSKTSPEPAQPAPAKPSLSTAAGVSLVATAAPTDRKESKRREQKVRGGERVARREEEGVQVLRSWEGSQPWRRSGRAGAGGRPKEETRARPGRPFLSPPRRAETSPRPRPPPVAGPAATRRAPHL